MTNLFISANRFPISIVDHTQVGNLLNHLWLYNILSSNSGHFMYKCVHKVQGIMNKYILKFVRPEVAPDWFNISYLRKRWRGVGRGIRRGVGWGFRWGYWHPHGCGVCETIFPNAVGVLQFWRFQCKGNYSVVFWVFLEIYSVATILL
jgi:hypothetical protein